MRSIAVTFVAHHSEEALRAAGASMVVPNLSVLDASVVCRLVSPNDESRPGA